MLIILFNDLSFDGWVIIIIDEDPLFLLGSCTSLLIETLFFEKIWVILDKTPGLSTTSNLRYAEKDRSEICLKSKFFLSLFEIEKGNLILPLRIDEISDIKAEVVAAGPAPSPWIILSPTGIPSIITALRTPSMLAT